MLLFSLDDWKCDQFRWNHFGRKMLKTEPVVCKAYYTYVGHNEERKEFKRYSYTILSQEGHLTVIHYMGDDSVVESDPHVRTCPSVLRELQQAVQSPSIVYKKQVSSSLSPLEHHPVLIPRNSKQVRTCRHCNAKNLGSVMMPCITFMSWHMIFQTLFTKL